MLTIDGSEGEGGGQILRSSLALSLCTGTPFRITRIRAGRAKPGLMRQHAVAVEAACAVSDSTATGANVGSTELMFVPGPVRSGDYSFSIGSAGSATLVAQTVLPALMLAEGRSTLLVEGGTHNPHAPPFEFLARAFLPLVNRMGPTIEARLVRHGFYPAGGGSVRVDIQSVKKLDRLDLLERGAIRRAHGTATVSALPLTIAEREVDALVQALGWDRASLAAVSIENGLGPGNVVVLEVESEHVSEVFTAFGEKGVSSESVAKRAAGQLRTYLDAGVPVGEYLCDQLLLPLALAGGGAFATLAPSMHTRTHADVVGNFLDVRVRIDQTSASRWEVSV